MGIKYFVNNRNWILKKKSRDCVLDVSVARRIIVRYIHIALDRSLTSLENTEEILALIMHEWRKYADQPTHEIVSPRLIHSIQWRYDCPLLKKKKVKKMSRLANQHKLVDKAVDSFFDMMSQKFSGCGFII